MNLLSQFNQTAQAVEEKKNPKQRSGESRSLVTQHEYEKHFGAGNTVAAASAAMGLTHVGCLNQIYRYERKGLMHRKEARDPATGGIIFAWGPK